MPRGLQPNSGRMCLHGRERANGLDYARMWRERNRPIFDEMDRRGAFLDSPNPRGLADA